MNNIKLLAGSLKGKNIIFYDNSVRITIFIIRKILFSWLEGIIYKARILDMFGGSGVLSFESFSRGASFVLIFEKNENLCKKIILNANKFDMKNLNVVNFDIFNWFKSKFFVSDYIKSFDIIFIDPPYNSNYLFYCLNFLFVKGCLTKSSYIYIESYLSFESEFLLFNYRIIKSKTIGCVKFYLIKKI